MSETPRVSERTRMDDLSADEQRKMREAAEIWDISAEDLLQLARNASGKGSPSQTSGNSPPCHEQTIPELAMGSAVPPIGHQHHDMHVERGIPQDQLYTETNSLIGGPGADVTTSLDDVWPGVDSALPGPFFQFGPNWHGEAVPHGPWTDSDYMWMDAPSGSAQAWVSEINTSQTLRAQVRSAETDSPFLPVAQSRLDSIAELGTGARASVPIFGPPPPPPRYRSGHRDVVSRRSRSRHADETQRQQTNVARQTKACIRCQLQRVKVCTLNLPYVSGIR